MNEGDQWLESETGTLNDQIVRGFSKQLVTENSLALCVEVSPHLSQELAYVGNWKHRCCRLVGKSQGENGGLWLQFVHHFLSLGSKKEAETSCRSIDAGAKLLIL